MKDESKKHAENQRQGKSRPKLHVRTDGDSRGDVGELERVVALEPVNNPLDDRERIGQRWHQQVAFGAEFAIDVRREHGDRPIGDVDHS